MAKRASSWAKAKQLAELHDYDDPQEFILECGQDSIAPGICMNEGCDNDAEVEPDCENGWCDNCKTNSVDSIHILLGII